MAQVFYYLSIFLVFNAHCVWFSHGFCKEKATILKNSCALAISFVNYKVIKNECD